MTDKMGVYKCEKCGIVIQVLVGGKGDLSCCSTPMLEVVENTVEAAKEKHIPVVEKIEEGYKIKVGSIPHPMEKEHYIQWVELVAENRSYFKFLKPEEKAEVVFKSKADNIYVRAYCNLHGLWKS